MVSKILSILHTVAKTGMNAKISGKYSSRLTDDSFAFINIHTYVTKTQVFRPNVELFSSGFLLSRCYIVCYKSTRPVLYFLRNGIFQRIQLPVLGSAIERAKHFSKNFCVYFCLLCVYFSTILTKQKMFS